MQEGLWTCCAVRKSIEGDVRIGRVRTRGKINTTCELCPSVRLCEVLQVRVEGRVQGGERGMERAMEWVGANNAGSTHEGGYTRALGEALVDDKPGIIPTSDVP